MPPWLRWPSERDYRYRSQAPGAPPAAGVTPSTAECDGHVTAGIAATTLYVAELAQNLARSQTSAPTDPVTPARIWFPYRSGFNRAVRLIGMAMLLGSALGLLGAVAGLPLNLLSMLAALLLSLGLIGFSVRPSLRRARF